MSQYLVVAHQTVSSPELLERLQSIADDDATAQFVLLIPATPVRHLLVTVEGEAREVARQTGEAAQTRFQQIGLNLSRVEVGDGSPLLAVEDELREHPAHYDAIVVCTFPLGISRWLGIDLPHQLEHKYAIPVIRVVAKAHPAASG